MLLGLLFVIFFAIINFALSKTIKTRGTSSLISFCVALLAVYGINRTSLDINGLFSSIGLSDKLIYSVVPILIIVGLCFMIWKLRLPRTLILVGILLIVLSFIADIYSKGLVLAIGIILVVIGIPLWIRSKKIEREKASSATRIRFQ
jgi:cytochrome c oxidase assembly factor CtaG